MMPAKIAFYRQAMRLRACVTRAGNVDLNAVDTIRWPRDALKAGAFVGLPYEAIQRCSQKSPSSIGELKADRDAVAVCLHQSGGPSNAAGSNAAGSGAPASGALVPGATGPGNQQPPANAADDCADQVLQQRLEGVAPEPLLLWLGYGRETTALRAFQPARVITAAVLVAVLVIACTVLLSRRVLAPIGALAVAARRLGAGDLSERVAVRGRDEIAELARSFNRMADSLQRSEAAQHRMVSDIAHELRTPLANIRGYLEALHDGVLEPDPDLVLSLLEEAVLQQRLIDDLQDLALAESGALRMLCTPLDVRELLETSRVAHRAVAESHRVELTVEAEAVPAVDADPDRLRQVVGNLVTNALAATPPGGRITLRASSAGGVVEIQVADTGRGIAPDELRHVFDRFWRADSARGRATGGRGLGLSIAQGIVQAHGGSLVAESTPGRGSTFTIVLPRADGPGGPE
ncbi:HAMP domain-containing protein [Actinomadura harenae]|uniref:histidine kinase n=2 Tax=Actinomadura harenae TaxID=2483351 RepID=A0A3M2MCW0_9ACTN|nr:HAMP domain-containing protein [Actinomadura harenae]